MKDGKQVREFQRVVRAFQRRFGGPPAAVVRAPGRVNLIGDHIDYLGLSVLPLAIQRSVWIALRARPDGLVRAENVAAGYQAVEFVAAREIAPGEAGSWGNYLRAGVSSALAAGGGRRAAGFDALVGGDLPAAAGLSSSSALVVAAALAALHAAGLAWQPLALAEALAAGERYVGTEGGGMDQAVCLCGRAGHALRVDFAPLRVHPIPVPRGWRILVAYSLEPSRKSAEVRAAYNERSRTARSALAAAWPGVRGDRLLELLAGGEAPPGGAAARQPRLRHVLSEGRRVLEAVRLLEAKDAVGFGQLMTASHQSLRLDYQVSTLALDCLVEAALVAGALGARLTGAGFGGCVIALCTAATLPRVRARLAEVYYGPAGADPAAAMFVARASDGAALEPLG